MFERWKRRRAERLCAHDLAQLPPYLLRDMGLPLHGPRVPLDDRAAMLVLTQHPRQI